MSQRFLLSPFPGEFWRRALMAIEESYPAVMGRLLAEYPRQCAIDLFPHELRATIETAFVEIANNFPSVEAFFAKNKAKNQHHVEISCGDTLFTISATSSENEMPRDAHFRRELASTKSSLPPLPFKEVGNPMLVDGKRYGILIHGPYSSRKKGKLGFASVLFISNDGDFVSYRVDLLKRKITPVPPDTPPFEPSLLKKEGLERN